MSEVEVTRRGRLNRMEGWSEIFLSNHGLNMQGSERFVCDRVKWSNVVHGAMCYQWNEPDDTKQLGKTLERSTGPGCEKGYLLVHCI